MNQYNFVLFFVLVVRGSHSISDEVKVLSNPRIPEQKRLKAGGIGILSAASKDQDKQGNYSLRRPPKLIIPQTVIRH